MEVDAMTTDEIKGMSKVVSRFPRMSEDAPSINQFRVEVGLVYTLTGELCIVTAVGQPIPQIHAEHAFVWKLGEVEYNGWVNTVNLQPGRSR